MADRESILANFQQITAIENVEIAICHLESTGWDLEAAVHLALEDNQPQFHDVKMLETVSPTTFMQQFSDIPGPSTSRDSDDLIFNVHFNDTVHQISISKNKTIKDLKEAILVKTSIPVCRQLIQGLPKPKNKELVSTDLVALRSLETSRENNVFLSDMTHDGFSDDVVFVSADPPTTYQLRILFTSPTEEKTLHLNFPASKTILDIKNDLYAVTKIPARNQLWTGWPVGSEDRTKLCDTELQHVHSLTLTRRTAENNSNNEAPVEIDSDNSIEFEDALIGDDDDIFGEPVPQQRIRSLIDDHTEEEILGCLQFVTNYRDRFGHGPNFFEGTLEDAVKTSCSTKSAKDRKLLAIYLHHDRSVLSNVFCGQLLNNQNIIQQLAETYVIYGWDLTYESNKNMFLSSLTACVTDSASLQIRNTPINQLPIIMILRKHRATCEVADIIHGNINSDELYTHLLANSESFKEQMTIEIREEYERQQREMLLMEQEQAYQESLLADRAKEEAKQQKEKMIASERIRQESERAETEARKEAIRKEAENSLPPEPRVDCNDITKIRFRKPTGDFMERRFTVDTKLKILLNFATANGFACDEFKLISSFPRRDLTTIDPNETLKALKLYPQETVILEER